MDPSILSSSFATIVGLVCNFKSQKENTHIINTDDFIDWLKNSDFSNLAKEIESNQQLLNGVKILLSENHKQILEKLNHLEGILFSFSSNMYGFKELSLGVGLKLELSQQAKMILENIANSPQGECMYRVGRKKEPEAEMLVAGGDRILLPEPKFVNDDFEQLLKLNLLSTKTVGQVNIYYITRLGYGYINSSG